MNNIHQLQRLVGNFSKVKVLCLGDIMVDRYVYGSISRISAEAPIPVMAQESEELMLGAVGNVARNVAALGGQATIIAIVGDDDVGRQAVRLIAEEEHLEADLVTISGRRTTLKTRFVAQGQQMLRADDEDVTPLNEKSVEQLIKVYRAALKDTDVVVLSDYAKGCLSDTVLAATIKAAREAGKPVLADPKSDNLNRYAGVSLVKPNAKELSQATGIQCHDNAAIAEAADKALNEAQIDAILVTRAEQGMTLKERGKDLQHFQEPSSEVFDVSGAGDTALATLALALGSKGSLSEATELANKTCRIVVSKVGTAVVYANELLQALQSAEFESAESKVEQADILRDKVARWRTQGYAVGFTNGCFDLLHAGHVSLLAQAKEACDRLIVGLNTDASVKRLKGDSRPINNEAARAIVLASLEAVDAVVLFDEDTPLKLIETLRPDILIKGADYTEDQVVGGDVVKSYGGRIFLAELAPELSTTRTISKIKG